MNEPSTDTSLLRILIHNDDAQAWDRLHKLYEWLVLKWLRINGVPEADLADVCQEVFDKVRAGIPKFEHGRFRGWLRTISFHAAMDFHRDRKRRREGGELDAVGGSDNREMIEAREDHHGDDQSENADLVNRLIELVKSEFEPNTWAAFWRTTVDELTTAEVAKELDMSNGAVRQAKYRVLKRLQEHDDLVELDDLNRRVGLSD